ncbi:MAG: tetratricopeptide repeat protein [Phycisphaerae bacterium]|nr:tetratricopeptide repeat protein [Phycisphaerae bacterium]
MSEKFDIEKMLGSIGKSEVPSEIRELSSGIISDFGRAVELVENNRSDKNIFVSWLGGVCYRFAAGAAFALVIIAAYFFMTSTSSIAWADVVAAMGKVDQMRAKVIVEDPRNKEEKIFTIEMFYKAPDKCRAHGRGFVQFINGDVNRIFSVEKGEMLKEGTGYPTVIPHGFMGMLKDKGLLGATLEMIFRGKVPEAEPVINTVLAGDGVEVFDYANDANEMWARIWVLKKSRLPVRLKVFYPGRDESNLVVFDYTDRQGNDFFDVDKFIDKAKGFRKGSTSRFYNIGKSVVTADPRKPEKIKPVNPVQIHELEGIKAPEFKSITHYTNGIIVIRAIDPGNRSEKGYGIDGEYHQELRDNRGNIYLRYHSTPGKYKGMKKEMFYFPVEPFIKGNGEHKIRLTYTIHDYQHNLGYDRVISNDEVVIPEPTEEFPKFLLNYPDHKHPGVKRQAYMNFMRSGGGDMLKQWDYIEAGLEETKDSEQMLRYKMQLIRELEGDKAYLSFFEDNLLDRYYKHGFKRLMYQDCLAEYLHHLYTNGRADEYKKHAKVFYKKMEDFLKDKNASKNNIDSIKNHVWWLSQVLEIPTVEKKLKKASTPKILKKKLSSDGKLLITFDFPKDKNGYRDRSMFTGGIKVAKTGEYIEPSVGNLYQFDVTGESLILLFDAALEGFLTDRKGGRYPKLTISKAVKIDLPKASDKDSEDLIKEFDAWKKEVDRRAKMSDRGLAVTEANQLRDDGKFKEAYDLFAKSVNLRMYDPEEFPQYGKAENQAIQQQVWFRLKMAECLIELGEIDNALRIIDECIESFLTMNEKPKKGLGGFACPDDVFKVRVRAAEWLIDNDKLDEAELLLKEIGKDKPDYRSISNLATVEKTPFGYAGVQKRVGVYFRWKVYDKAVWKLRRARNNH